MIWERIRFLLVWTTLPILAVVFATGGVLLAEYGYGEGYRVFGVGFSTIFAVGSLMVWFELYEGVAGYWAKREEQIESIVKNQRKIRTLQESIRTSKLQLKDVQNGELSLPTPTILKDFEKMGTRTLDNLSNGS